MGVILDRFLLPEQLVLEGLSEQYTQAEIANIIKHKDDHFWLVQVFKGVLRLLSISLITSVLSLGLLVNDYRVKWLSVLKVVTLAQFVFFIPVVLKLFWFLFIQTDYTYATVSDFSAFSLYSLLDYAEDWQKGPLKQLNLFEVLFWVVLAVGLKRVYDISLNRGMAIVMQSYGVSFFLWMTVSVFLSIL